VGETYEFQCNKNGALLHGACYMVHGADKLYVHEYNWVYLNAMEYNL